jgi:hypothetical protein
MKNATLFIGLTFLLGLGLAGSFSDSSKSISNSISSPFKWSSGSFAGGGDTAYRQQIRDYTYAYTHSGGEISAFRRGVGSLAAKRGVTDWESDDATVTAIGAGLRQSGMGKTEMQEFAAERFPGSPAQSRLVEKGYASAR